MSGFKLLVLSATVLVLFDTFWLTTAQRKTCSEEYDIKLNAARTKLNMLREEARVIGSKLTDFENGCCSAASSGGNSCSSTERNELEEQHRKYTTLISDLLDVDGGLETHLMSKYCNVIVVPDGKSCPKVIAVQSNVDMLTEALAETQSTLQTALANSNRMMSLLQQTEVDLAAVKIQCCKKECPEGSGKINPDGTRVCIEGCQPICELFIPEEEQFFLMRK